MNNVLPPGGIYVADTLVIATEFLRCPAVGHCILTMCKAILFPDRDSRQRCELTGTKSAKAWLWEGRICPAMAGDGF